MSRTAVLGLLIALAVHSTAGCSADYSNHQTMPPVGDKGLPPLGVKGSFAVEASIAHTVHSPWRTMTVTPTGWLRQPIKGGWQMIELQAEVPTAEGAPGPLDFHFRTDKLYQDGCSQLRLWPATQPGEATLPLLGVDSWQGVYNCHGTDVSATLLLEPRSAAPSPHGARSGIFSFEVISPGQMRVRQAALRRAHEAQQARSSQGRWPRFEHWRRLLDTPPPLGGRRLFERLQHRVEDFARDFGTGAAGIAESAQRGLKQVSEATAPQRRQLAEQLAAAGQAVEDFVEDLAHEAPWEHAEELRQFFEQLFEAPTTAAAAAAKEGGSDDVPQPTGEEDGGPAGEGEACAVSCTNGLSYETSNVEEYKASSLEECKQKLSLHPGAPAVTYFEAKHWAKNCFVRSQLEGVTSEASATTCACSATPPTTKQRGTCDVTPNVQGGTGQPKVLHSNDRAEGAPKERAPANDPAEAAGARGVRAAAQAATPTVAARAVPRGGGPSRALVGADRDAHDCVRSAGYSWCEAKGKCLRPWDERCEAEPAKPQRVPGSFSVAGTVDLRNGGAWQLQPRLWLRYPAGHSSGAWEMVGLRGAINAHGEVHAALTDGLGDPMSGCGPLALSPQSPQGGRRASVWVGSYVCNGNPTTATLRVLWEGARTSDGVRWAVEGELEFEASLGASEEQRRPQDPTEATERQVAVRPAESAKKGRPAKSKKSLQGQRQGAGAKTGAKARKRTPAKAQEKAQEMADKAAAEAQEKARWKAAAAKQLAVMVAQQAQLEEEAMREAIAEDRGERAAVGVRPEWGLAKKSLGRHQPARQQGSRGGSTSNGGTGNGGSNGGSNVGSMSKEDTSQHTAEQRSCIKGDEVRAVWAGNGKYYPARIAALNAVAGTATVDWADGDATNRVVALSHLLKQRRPCLPVAA